MRNFQKKSIANVWAQIYFCQAQPKPNQAGLSWYYNLIIQPATPTHTMTLTSKAKLLVTMNRPKKYF